MTVAVLSDIHDNIWRLEKMLDLVASAEVLIFCGDFCAPFTLKQIGDNFTGPVHCVFGNNDGDRYLLTEIASTFAHVTLHGELAETKAEGRSIAVNHYPEIAEGLAASGKYDVVCFGHDHQYRVNRVGETLAINPGEVMGRFGVSGAVLLDLTTMETERVVVK